MPLTSTFGSLSSQSYGWSKSGETFGGMVLVSPTSIVSTGTGNSSTINPNGSVTFTSCATVSLNGVFTSAFDNYMVVLKNTTGASGATYPSLRYRAGNSDNSSPVYTSQQLAWSGSSYAGARSTTQTLVEINYNDGGSVPSGSVLFIYGPNLAQPTAGRELEVRTYASAGMADEGHTFNGNTQFDGLTILEYYGARMSGIVSIYGLNG